MFCLKYSKHQKYFCEKLACSGYDDHPENDVICSNQTKAVKLFKI